MCSSEIDSRIKCPKKCRDLIDTLEQASTEAKCCEEIPQKVNVKAWFEHYSLNSGGAGQHNWGKPGDEEDYVMVLDQKDPNYNSETEPTAQTKQVMYCFFFVLAVTTLQDQTIT